MASALEEAAPEVAVRVIPIRTSGDQGAGNAATVRQRGGDKSRFVKEIEEALLREEVDLAVHSAKDVPGELPAGLRIVGVPERADARDALCGAGALGELPEGAVVGTSSLRRRAQLLAERPDLAVKALRGNVDTRLRRLNEDGYGAIVLAVAGLRRLDRSPDGVLSPDVMTPAPGQGCLALEGRVDDARTATLAERVTHRESLLRLTAERALVSAIDASCRTPVGAHAVIDGEALSLSAFVGMPDGSAWIRDAVGGASHHPGDLGRAVAERLLAAGAEGMLAAAEG